MKALGPLALSYLDRSRQGGSKALGPLAPHGFAEGLAPLVLRALTRVAREDAVRLRGLLPVGLAYLALSVHQESTLS